jgi:hypothetical protein
VIHLFLGYLTVQLQLHWEDNIKTGVKWRGLEGVDWIHLAQDRDQ